MHLKRLVVAVILLPLLYLYIMRLPTIYFLGLILFISTIALWEFYSMYGLKGFMKVVGILIGLSVPVIFYKARGNYGTALIMIVMLLFVIRLIVIREPSSSLKDLGHLLIPIFYIPCLLNFQLLLREIGPEWVIFLYGSVWVADSLAFYIGKGIGKRRLYKEVSPNKTLEGAVGSLIGGLIAAYLFSLFLIDMKIGRVILTGLIIGLSAIIGDLIESMFKRDAGVKDSSNLIPGHGGILDKIDSSLFTGPILWLIMRV